MLLKFGLFSSTIMFESLEKKITPPRWGNLIDSTDADNVENSIYRMLDYYECVTKTNCDFTEEEIKELAHCCEHQW